MPPTDETRSIKFVRVTDATLFTSVDKWVLDSIYFRPHFQVRCIAQPLHENGNPGVPLTSRPVTIGHTNPICRSPSFASLPDVTSYQAQSFLATLDYVKPDDRHHPNTVHISVQVNSSLCLFFPKIQFSPTILFFVKDRLLVSIYVTLCFSLIHVVVVVIGQSFTYM